MNGAAQMHRCPGVCICSASSQVAPMVSTTLGLHPLRNGPVARLNDGCKYNVDASVTQH